MAKPLLWRLDEGWERDIRGLFWRSKFLAIHPAIFGRRMPGRGRQFGNLPTGILSPADQPLVIHSRTITTAHLVRSNSDSRLVELATRGQIPRKGLLGSADDAGSHFW